MPKNDAHFHEVVEKDQRQKVKKPSHLVKNDVDAEHLARVRRAEGISDPTSSSSPFENDEFHRKRHKDGLELELLSSVVSSPSKASVSSVIVSNQVVPESSDPCQEALPGFVKPAGSTNRRRRKAVKNAFNVNTKSIMRKFACSPDSQKMLASEHGFTVYSMFVLVGII